MDLKQLLRELGVTIHKEASNGWYVLDCCYCGRSGKPGLGINSRSLGVSCFKCGNHKINQVLADLTGRDIREINRLLPGLYNSAAPRVERPKGKYSPPAGVGPLLRPHRDYLQKRRFDPDELSERHQIAGIGPGTKLQWRIFLPIPLNHEPVTWTTRAIGDDPFMRYISARPEQEAQPIHSILGGEDDCRHVMIVVEGPLDWLRIGPGAGCTFGTSYTMAQVVRIARFPIRVVCFDADSQAQQRAMRLCSELAAFPGLTYNVVLNAKDPADASEDEIRELKRRFLE